MNVAESKSWPFESCRIEDLDRFGCNLVVGAEIQNSQQHFSLHDLTIWFGCGLFDWDVFTIKALCDLVGCVYNKFYVQCYLQRKSNRVHADSSSLGLDSREDDRS